MDYHIRPAEDRDVADLARLQVLGSDGIIAAIYDGLIPGQSVAEMLERRFFFQNSTKSYRHCWVAESDGRVIGDLHAHPFDAMTGDPSDPIVPEERYAVVEPFDALDRVGEGTYHVNVVAVFPDFQGNGVGAALTELALQNARDLGLGAVSLVCFEENKPAMTLYARHGFKEAARAPAAKHPLIQHGGDLLMLVAPV
ncbi:MAG: GNAT family N-acetyltransferase [Pseudomonadota bacterium]